MMTFPRWFLVSAILFFSGVIAGFIAPVSFDVESIAPLGEIVDDLGTLSSPVVFTIILANNLIAISFAFFLSPLFCLVPIFSLAVNGLLIGIVGSVVIEQESFLYLAAGILPHGIIEIPALLIALSAALNFGFTTIKGLFKKETRGMIFPAFITNIKYLALAGVLLVPAAFIETFVTPVFLGLF